MPQRRHVIVDGTRLETLVYAVPRPSLPTIVLLHEALGSARSWNRFAPRLAAATGRGVVAYSRQGAGSSDPLQQPRQRDYLQREAEAVLPALLHACGIDRPILFGHSDGASIALVYAGAFPSHTGALILEAPHVFVEQITLAGIEHAARDFHHGELRAKLARYHDDVDSVFAAWHDLWLDPAFRAWNIEEYLSSIRCPVLVIQGDLDQYGTVAQADAIARRVHPCDLLVLPDCGHVPHRERADETLSASVRFLAATAAP